MRTYTRAHIQGGCYFFTVNLAERRGNDLLVQRIADLREAFRRIRAEHPFAIDGIVILPHHLHCIWQLPEGDSDFPMRWRLIKARFSRSVAPGEWISPSRPARASEASGNGDTESMRSATIAIIAPTWTTCTSIRFATATSRRFATDRIPRSSDGFGKAPMRPIGGRRMRVSMLMRDERAGNRYARPSLPCYAPTLRIAVPLMRE
jgi:REP element-mobilizing transposase RayT